MLTSGFASSSKIILLISFSNSIGCLFLVQPTFSFISQHFGTLLFSSLSVSTNFKFVKSIVKHCDAGNHARTILSPCTSSFLS